MVSGVPTPVAIVRDVDAGGVPCRLYDPRRGHGAPVLVYVHGGGWIAGSLTTADAACRRLADRSGCAVLSVGYRLAPEATWPAAIEDVETAVSWLRANAEEHGLDASRLAVGGDSAGGNVAAVLARRARDAGTAVRVPAAGLPGHRRGRRCRVRSPPRPAPTRGSPPAR